jgi:hypothetical protein
LIMMLIRSLIFSLILLSLSACSGGAVVFAPTALPPEAAPNQYQHPSGAFSLLLPRTWALFEQENSLFASASFAPPNSETAIVQIVAINFGREIEANEMVDIVQQYQSQVRPDLGRYTEQERNANPDGSWRITGLRQSSSGETQQSNTFIRRSGAVLSIVEVTVPLDAALRSQIQTIVNTLNIAPSAELPVAGLTELTNAATAQIEIINIATWSSPEGVFFVTGEVANHSSQDITNLPIRVILLSEDGSILADGGDVVMGYAVSAGGFAPFGLRFGQGQPSNASRYSISIGSETYAPPETAIIAYPVLQWVDNTQSTADGDLFITGTVTNTGEAAVLSPRATVTLFDDRGRVIGAGFADASVSILPAGAEAEFTVLISDMGATPANYVVNVQALPCDASCE